MLSPLSLSTQSFFDLENNNQELKSDPKDLFINSPLELKAHEQEEKLKYVIMFTLLYYVEGGIHYTCTLNVQQDADKFNNQRNP